MPMWSPSRSASTCSPSCSSAGPIPRPRRRSSPAWPAAPAVLECHHVTGSWNYLLKVRLPNTRDLERFLGQVVKEVQGVERTETIIALSSAKETTTLISDPLGQQS